MPGKKSVKNVTRPKSTGPEKNTLYYGDNLSWMDHWGVEEIADLIYLDPPFNSNEDYNILFGLGGNGTPAQMRAFEDTWRWGHKAAEDRDTALQLGGSLANAIEAFEKLFPASPMLAYLCHLAPRLHKLHGLLKQRGSIYLHCDDTAGPHIKLLMDAVFGPENYRNLVIWRRATSHNDASRFGRIADLILFYSKGSDPYWNGDAIATPKSSKEIAASYPSQDDRGRFRADNLTGPLHGAPKSSPSTMPWRDYDVHAMGRCWSVPKTGHYATYIEQHFIPNYKKIKGVHDRLDRLDEARLIYHPKKGRWPGLKRYASADRSNPPQNIILEPTGFTNFNKGKEYLGYPTQKPEALLRKLIDAACPPRGLVLDPYCGCGTAIHVAQQTSRAWIGIDITHLAIGIIEHRFSERLNLRPRVVGQPQDMQGARDLFDRDPFQFEAWAVSRIPGIIPNEIQSGDRGVDGRGYAPEGDRRHLVLVQVKGGKSVSPATVRELRGTMARENARLGILIVMDDKVLTRGARKEMAQGTVNISGAKYNLMQEWTIQDFFDGKRPELPPMLSEFRNRERDWIDELND